MMGRASRRKHKSESVGHFFGVDLFEDSCLWRFAVCEVHYARVEATEVPDPFPLADVDDETKTNANIVLAIVQPHRADTKLHAVVHHRYFHRDSTDTRDHLDLKRGQIYTLKLDQLKVDEIIEAFCRLISTDEHFHLCAPIEVHDFTNAPSIHDALQSFTSLRGIHTTVMAPEGGVQ